jgi:hypothetical protein
MSVELLGLAQYIGDDAPDTEAGPQSINSIQNGFLLRSDIQDAFDCYHFGINPDVSYILYAHNHDSCFGRLEKLPDLPLY